VATEQLKKTSILALLARDEEEGRLWLSEKRT
jgi:hypothetical protein